MATTAVEIKRHIEGEAHSKKARRGTLLKSNRESANLKTAATKLFKECMAPTVLVSFLYDQGALVSAEQDQLGQPGRALKRRSSEVASKKTTRLNSSMRIQTDDDEVFCTKFPTLFMPEGEDSQLSKQLCKLSSAVSTEEWDKLQRQMDNALNKGFGQRRPLPQEACLHDGVPRLRSSKGHLGGAELGTRDSPDSRDGANQDAIVRSALGVAGLRRVSSVSHQQFSS